MKKIKSFIYLDNYKMYSISSQIFEGLTEYVVKHSSKSKSESESQKGPIGSGRILADIVESSANESEKRFLHDYSYNLFEDALVNEGKVLDINIYNIDEQLSKINDYSFVKIKGRVIFNDAQIIENTIAHFNEIGYALGFLSKKQEYDEQINELKEQIKSIPDRNQKAQAKSLTKQCDFKTYLQQNGLGLDPELLKQLTYIIDFGYNQQFEIQLPIATNDSPCIFSAQLDRTYLKDNETRIIKKFSRATEKEFTLFGLLTQTQKEDEKEDLFELIQKEDTSIPKEAIINMILSLSGVEKTFTGKLDNEYVIDPIALYLEL